MRNNINIQLYSSCNCDCSFCHFKDKLYNKIDPKFVLDYLDKNEEINYIVLTGGEPTLAIDEYIQIVKGIDQTKKRVILQTNGWWGNNETIKNAIKNNPPSIVHLSADSEKQKIINLSVVVAAYNFLKENNIIVYVVDHTTSEDEYNTYKSIFPEIKLGDIIYDNDEDLHDCGIALLANNTVGNLNIKGWL